MKIELARNGVFAECWGSRRRYIVMTGGAGSGKSCDCALFYVSRLLSEPGRNLLCVRKTDAANRNSTFAELCKAIARLGLSDEFKINLTGPRITCRNGNEALFAGVADERQREKLKSVTASCGQITDVWIEEATELSQEDFEIIDDRLRGVLPGDLFYQIRLSFNPVSSSHWLKRAFFDRPDANTLVCKSTYRDNAFCDRAFYERMERRRQADPDGYRIYGLGEWGEAGGLVFCNYIIEDFAEDFDALSYGQDFGFNHANALLKVGLRDGEIYVCDELYIRGKTTDEIIALASDWDKQPLMHCDSAEPDRITMWARAGFRAVGVKKYPGSVKYAIDWLKQRRLHIRPQCAGLIAELEEYRWGKDKYGRERDDPPPGGDDAVAALRYACCEWILNDRTRAAREPPFLMRKSEPAAALGKGTTVTVL